MNYADIKEIDIQDGDGVRVSIYVSGCHFHCKECHNPEAWDFNYGKEFTEKEIEYIIEKMDNSYISGLSILGGEPLEISNQQGLLPLVERVKEKFPDKDIWLYTGYLFDRDILCDMYKKYNFTKKLIDKLDIVIDGQFVIEKKITDLKARGSYNQRKIDVKASIKEGKAVCLKFGDELKYESKLNSGGIKKFFVGANKQGESGVENSSLNIHIPVFSDALFENVEGVDGAIQVESVQEQVAADLINKDIKRNENLK